MDFRQLERKYQTDAAFNQMVNLFHQLISEYQFMPSEIREAMFMAQYKFEMNSVRQVVQSQKQIEAIAVLCEQARHLFEANFSEHRGNVPQPPDSEKLNDGGSI